VAPFLGKSGGISRRICNQLSIWVPHGATGGAWYTALFNCQRNDVKLRLMQISHNILRSIFHPTPKIDYKIDALDCKIFFHPAQ